MHAPIVKSARARRRYRIGLYKAAFLDQIIAEGSIGYEFIIVVFQEGATEPFLLVTSERSDPTAVAELFEELGLEDISPEQEGGTHFLCIFDEQGHSNLGDSDAWGNADHFEMAALNILTQRLGDSPTVVWNA